jgi:hypothetical protein
MNTGNGAGNGAGNAHADVDVDANVPTRPLFLCCDCQYMAFNGKCTKFGQIEPVHGKLEYMYASTCRLFASECGPAAQHFVYMKRNMFFLMMMKYDVNYAMYIILGYFAIYVMFLLRIVF